MIKKSSKNYQISFLQPNLMDQLDPKHPLLLLSKAIPWDYFEKEFFPLYSPKGRGNQWTVDIFRDYKRTNPNQRSNWEISTN